MTLDEVSSLFGIPKDTTEQLAAHGKIRVRRISSDRKVLRIFPYRVDIESYYHSIHFCHWCDATLERAHAKSGSQYCSNGCRGKAERARWTDIQKARAKVHFLKYQATKWWRRPDRAEKQRRSTRDWYERTGRARLGHTRRGERLSLPERQLQTWMKIHFPNDQILYNDRSTGHEFDAWNTTKNWVIDIRGIYHFKPVYGESHLNRVLYRDAERELACIERRIRLIVLDVSRFRGGLSECHYLALERFLL